MNKRLLILLLLASTSWGCGNPQSLRPEAVDPDLVRDGELVMPPTPARPDAPGKEAIRRWALACYRQGLARNPIFSRGGSVIVRWTADRNGQLLQMEFLADSFRGWSLDAAGQTLSDCIIAQAQAAQDAPAVAWSAAGAAPLRFLPDDSMAASQPSASPAQPAPASLTP